MPQNGTVRPCRSLLCHASFPEKQLQATRAPVLPIYVLQRTSRSPTNVLARSYSPASCVAGLLLLWRSIILVYFIPACKESREPSRERWRLLSFGPREKDLLWKEAMTAWAGSKVRLLPLRRFLSVVMGTQPGTTAVDCCVTAREIGRNGGHPACRNLTLLLGYDVMMRIAQRKANRRR